jgi:hypothetical protein
MSCEGCKFYEGLYEGSATGYCHRHAPRPFVVAGGVDSAEWSFPTVSAIEWCGEFEQRPTLHAPDAANAADESA